MEFQIGKVTYPKLIIGRLRILTMFSGSKFSLVLTIAGGTTFEIIYCEVLGTESVVRATEPSYATWLEMW